MKHQIHIGESITLPLLRALLVDQVNDGDAEGAHKTRALIAKLEERQRLRHQAIKAGRWPFVVSEPNQPED